MAARQKSQNTPRWPAVAAVADLPNVNGSSVQDDALEAGDTCYVTGDSLLYVCDDPTQGSAAWSVLGPRDRRTARIIVGHELMGDSLKNCDYLDPGDGTGIEAALIHAATLGYPLTIDVLEGEITRAAGSGLFTLPAGVHLRGAGVGRTVIVVRSGSAGVEPWCAIDASGARSGVSGITFRAAGFTAAGASGTMNGIVTLSSSRCFAHDLELDLDTYAPFTITTMFWTALVHIAMPGVDHCDVRNLDVNAASAQNVTGAGYFALNAVGSRATATYDYLGQTPMPVIRNVCMHGRQNAATLYYVPVYMRAIVAFDLCGVWASNCQTAVAVVHRDGQSFGPRINDVTYFSEANNTQGVTVECRSLLAGDWLENIHIDSVRAHWSGGTGWTNFPVTVYHHSTSVSEIRNMIIANVQAQRTAADGTVRLELYPQNTGLIHNVSLQSIRLPSTDSTVIIGSGAGAVTDAHIEQMHVAVVTVHANATDTILANSRIHTTFTNLSASTSWSNVIIGA